MLIKLIWRGECISQGHTAVEKKSQDECAATVSPPSMHDLMHQYFLCFDPSSQHQHTPQACCKRLNFLVATDSCQIDRPYKHHLGDWPLSFEGLC